MKISKAHQKFADYLKNESVLENPEEFLGENWKDVLNFWFYLDTLSLEQLKNVGESFASFFYNNRDESSNLTNFINRNSTIRIGTFYQHVWVSSRDVVLKCKPGWNAGFATAWATGELISSNEILKRYNSLTFLPMFLNL